MAIKKDAAKADIGPKKQVKATFAECTAENPLKCKYHGIGALQKLVGDTLYNAGLGKVANICTKDGKGYKIQIPQEVNIPENAYSALSDALFDKGFSLDYKDIENNMTVFTAVRTDGGDFVTPEGEAELEDADTLSSTEAPENNTVSKSTVTKKDPFAELENMDVDALIAENELDADLMDNFDELDEVTAEATEDLENELIGNDDYDDIIFSEVDENLKPQELDEQDIKELMLLQGIQPSYFATHDDLMPEYKAIISTGKNKSGTDLSPSQKAWWGTLINEVKKQGFDNPAAKQLLKTFGKEGDQGKNKEITKEDCVALMSAAGHEVDNYPDDAAEQWYHIITTGKHANGYPISGNVLAKDFWKKIAEKAEQSGEELAALPVLKATLAKLEGREKQKTLTDDDIVEAFNPIYDPTEDGPLEKNTYIKEFYKSVLTNPSGQKLAPAQLNWFKEASEIAHAEGINNYAVELLDKMLEENGMLTKPSKLAVGAASDNGAEPPTKESLLDEMGNVINHIHETGLSLTWDKKKGNELGTAFEKAINANDLEGAAKALNNFKDYIHKLESGDEDTSVEGDSVTTEEIGDFFKNCGIKKKSLLSEENLTATKEALESGLWQGKPLTKGNKKWYAALAKKVPDHKVAKAINAMLEGGEMPVAASVEPKKFSLKEIKDFLGTYSGHKKLKIPEKSKEVKDILGKGTVNGKPIGSLEDWEIEELEDDYKACDNGPIKDAILSVLGNKGITASTATSTASSGGGAKDAIVSALSEGGGKSMVVEGMLKPLEHDASKFPQKITQDELDKAIKVGKKLGGHGGLGTRLVEIGGKQYVCKAASGTGASVIKNGYNADMAYRSGGVYAPDAQLYEFGDGKIYKLSEFVKGKRLIDVWQTADEATRDGIRKELLKGYPLDVLFSNYDVLGTSPEDSVSVTIQGADGKPQQTHVAFNNIMIGDDGHAYRVDNDGSFAMTGTGGIKHSGGGGYITKVEAENWGNWADRKWIDDFRTLRRNEKNLGIFDRYSTADIFLSAGNINLDAVVGTLPNGIQKALAKPLFEMKQMTWRAVNISLGGYKNNEFISMALDASYEASKRGLRELCKMNVSWNNAGFGAYKKSWGAYQMKDFDEPMPEEPKDPSKELKEKLPNDAYTGKKIISVLLGAVKTINNHGGVKQTDAQGNVLGNGYAMKDPDYKPNQSKIAEWEKIDREKLEELAKTDAGAATCLGIYDTIAYSKANGWKKPIGQIPTDIEIKAKLPEGYQSPTEKKLQDDMAGAIEQFKKDHEHYENVTLPEYLKRKSAHIQAEEAKAKKAGGSIYHNFHHFAELLMGDGISTDGVMHKVKTSGIAPIESSMHAQKGSSYATAAVKWKVREMMALGHTPDQILQMGQSGDLYNGNSYVSVINNLLLPNKAEWDRDMASQAMYLGMNMVKMENELNDVYDKKSGVIFLNRNISSTPQGLNAAEEALYNSKTDMGWVGPHVDSAADCMQFEKNSWSGTKKQVYAVPLSRIVCCANNATATGAHQDYGYNENEYVGNLYNLPCWVYHPSNNLTWKVAIDNAKKSSGMMGMLKKFAQRLGFFNTLTN